MPLSHNIPKRDDLMDPIFQVLKQLGGSGSNDEIYDNVVDYLHLSDEVLAVSHNGSLTQSEVAYQMAWSKTYLKKYGVLNNSTRGVWSITPEYKDVDHLDGHQICIELARRNRYEADQESVSIINDNPDDGDPTNDDVEFPEELKPWRSKVEFILANMDPFGFERLCQRVLRECGFSEVIVTKKTADGGIDGVGKLKINGIFSFSIAFQCKRYAGQVSAGDIRDFRGSLSTDIEKGIMITTGSFSAPAKKEASASGKKQIDLVDGEEFINKLVQYEIGLKPVLTYEVDEAFFASI